MDSKEALQNQILQDIKAIAKELSQVQSFPGLLAHQQKIQALYEKYIFIKQLNTNKYQQILHDPVIEDAVKNLCENKPESKDLYEIPEQKEAENNTKPLKEKDVEEEIIDKWVEKDKKEITQEIQETENETKKEETRGLKPLKIEIAEIKPVEKEKKLSPVNLDFNDSIAFISQLFNGNKADMDAEFQVLNNTRSLEEAKKWMEEMFHKYNWKNKAEFVERLSELIVNRFES